MANSNSKILINLSAQGRRARAGSEQEFVHSEALARILALLRANAREAEKQELYRRNEKDGEQSFFQDHRHTALTVHGTRGSGKTTFIRNVLQYIRSVDVELSNSFWPLPVIDPTLLEQKQNVVVVVIGLINDACTLHWQEKHPGPLPDSYYAALKLLARALTVMEGVGPERAYSDSWEDPQYVLESGLQTTSSQTQFRAHFEEYLAEALALVSKGCFLVTFDDIDTDFGSGWPVLEALRKYLVSSKLQVIVSGDIELYARLVRRALYKNFGREMMEVDRPSLEHHAPESLPHWADDNLMSAVFRLEDQYLQKLLQPSYRIALSTLRDYAENLPRGSIEFYDSEDEGVSARPVFETLRTIVTRGTSIRDARELRSIVDVLMEQPLRTVVQVLRSTRSAVSENVETVVTAGAVARDMTAVFSSSLYHVGVSPQLIGGNGDEVIGEFSRWMTTQSRWAQASRLRLDSKTNDENLTVLCFAAQLTRVFAAEPSQALAFLVKVGFVNQLIVQRPDGIEARAIVAATGMDRREPAATVARLSVATQRELFRGPYGMGRGIVALYGTHVGAGVAIPSLYRGFKKTSETGRVSTATFFAELYGKIELPAPLESWVRKLRDVPFDEYKYLRGTAYNTFDSLVTRTQDGRGNLLKLAACIVTDRRGQDTTVLSIFSFIGILSELIKTAEVSRRASSGFDHGQSMRTQLEKLCQLRSYHSPAFATGRGVDVNLGAPTAAEDSDEEYFPENTLPPRGDYLYDVLEQWGNTAAATDVGLPASTFSRIATRLFYTLARMDVEVPVDSYFAGQLFHRQVIAFLNAVLVEEMLARGVDRAQHSRRRVGPILDNPTASDVVFYRNFPATGRWDPAQWRDLPLFRTIFSCPLIGLFINPEPVIGGRLHSWNLLEAHVASWQSFLGTEHSVQLPGSDALGVRVLVGRRPVSFPNLWAPLNSVPVVGATTAVRRAAQQAAAARN